jgi:lysophospholipase L1-like esterase
MPLKTHYLTAPLSLLLGFFLCLSAGAQKLRWHDARTLPITGKGWTETNGVYDRLPAKAESAVRKAVWDLSRNSAGIAVHFVTDSPEISVRWKLTVRALALPNMAAASYSGVDLYVKDAGGWRWAGAGRADKLPLNEARILGDLSPRKRDFMLYLPLYNGVETVEIGLAENASLSSSEPFPAGAKPIVFYGTSIVQGASASRPGLAYPAMLSRRLNQPALNLGFSGNCKMEPEIAALLAELDPSVYFIDCLPNLSTEEVAAKAPDFLKTLRRARPGVPIVLVENIIYPDSVFVAKKRAEIQSKNAALKRVYQNLLRAGARNLHYIRADNLLGTDGEATIDGVHPTDVGFERMANAFEPILRRILRTGK